MRVCNVMCILQKYTLPNLWLQTGRPLAEKQSVFHQQRWGWVAVQLFLFAFRWILILDLIESSRVLMQQHDILYYIHGNKILSKTKQTQVSNVSFPEWPLFYPFTSSHRSTIVLQLESTVSTTFWASLVFSPIQRVENIWCDRGNPTIQYNSTLSIFQETKPEFHVGDLYLKKVHQPGLDD